MNLADTVFQYPRSSEINFCHPYCEGTLLALDHLDYQSDKKRTSLQDRERLGNDAQSVLGFLSRCSWMFPEQLRNDSELVGLEENHQA